MDDIILTTPRARYEWQFAPLATADLRTPGQRARAAAEGATHACRFPGEEPAWLARAAAAAGYRAVCLGYTRSRQAGYVVSETWGLVPLGLPARSPAQETRP